VKLIDDRQMLVGYDDRAQQAMQALSEIKQHKNAIQANTRHTK